MRAAPLACAAGLLFLPALQAQPGLQRFTLPNGLRVLHLEDRERPLVRALLHLKVEPGDVPAGGQGLPALMLRVLDHSAVADLEAEAFDRMLDDAGILFRAAAEGDGLRWRLVARSRDQDRALGLLADRVLRSQFDPLVFEAQQLALGRQQKRQEAHPHRLLRQFLAGDPEHRPSAVSLGALPLEALLRFRARVFRPDRALLVIHGDLGLEQAKRLVLLSLGTWTPQAPLPGQWAPAPAPSPAPTAREASPRVPAPGLGLRVQALAARPRDLDPAAAALLRLLLSHPAALAPLRLSLEEDGLLATLDGGAATGAQAWSQLHDRLEALRLRGFTQADLDLARAAWKARRSLDSLHPEAQMDATLAEALGRGVSQEAVQATPLEAINEGLRRWLDPARLRSGAAGEPEILRALPRP